MKPALFVLLCGAGFLGGCQSMPISMGDTSAKTVATGSAGGANAQNANTQLERCDKPLGTIAFVEEANQPWLSELYQQYRVQSTVPLLRLMVQQSNCFVVVERGRAFNNMNLERDLAKSGELRANSKMGKGQMVAADYTATPSISFSQRGTGGIGGALGGWAGAVTALAGSLKSNEASTMLLLTDNRSGVQLAAAEGSAKNWDFGIAGAMFGGSGWGSAGGFTNTPQGKVLAAAFMDSYNGLVRAVRNYQAQAVPGGLGAGGNLKVN
jgi:curli biogenesis system outer membrane secretion channel CsgG